MQSIEFTKEDEYCIRNFGYNEVRDYEDLKQFEDKGHLVIEELEYRIQQRENIIEDIRNYVNTDKNCVPKHIKDYINNLVDKEIK